MRLKFPSHLNIRWEESKLTGKVTWMNSLAAMNVVRFTWKPSQTTWIQWSWSLCPRHPSELHREASAKKHQKSASKPWHKLHPCSAPLGIDMRFLFTPISWHLSKSKLGQKVQRDFIPSFKKHGAFPAPAHLSCSTYSWWPWRQLSDIQPLFSRRSWSSLVEKSSPSSQRGSSGEKSWDGSATSTSDQPQIQCTGPWAPENGGQTLWNKHEK